MACTPKSTTTVDEDGATRILAVHPDVLETHILTRLDGPTLASASCASSQLHALSTQENLWRNICHSTWPSTDNPRMHQLISTFPDGHRSFFSDSFPLLIHPPVQNHPHHPPSAPPPELISAVDIFYRNKLIFSKVQETETQSGWFRGSPFRIDLLDPKDMVPTPIEKPNGQDTCKDLANNLSLSWIAIDPTRRRAANLSGWSPVSVQRHWLSGEMQVRYATILAVDRGSTEFVQCGILVTCGGCEGGEMHVREVNLQVEDMDGVNLNGKESMVILERALESGKRRRRRGGREEEGRERYEEFLEKKKERKQRKLKREWRLDMMCMASGVSIFSAFWMFVFFR